MQRFILDPVRGMLDLLIICPHPTVIISAPDMVYITRALA